MTSRPKKKLAQVLVLCNLLGCEPQDLIRHKATVYEWEDIYYEVVGKNSLTAPHSHYSRMWTGKRLWFVRELGKKSKILKEL